MKMKRIVWAALTFGFCLSSFGQEKEKSKEYFEIGSFKEVYDPAWGVSTDPWCINDHTFMRDKKTGKWHVWGITHARKMDYMVDPGLNLLHITADSLLQKPWVTHPFALTASKDYHESLLWAPHCVYHKGKYYLYVCAGAQEGAHVHEAYQINLYISKDLKKWHRYKHNPLFTDGFDARDPMVIKNGERWILYYTANSTSTGGNHIVAAYTSKDLLHWTNRTVVFTHSREGTFGGPTESPFVLRRGNRYYMFLCDGGHTDVYVSNNPLHFEQKDLIAEINDCRASELIRDEKGRYYISSAGWFNGTYGLKIAPIIWKDGLDNESSSLNP